MTDLEKYRDRLVDFSTRLGYKVELESKMEDQIKQRLEEIFLALVSGEITEEQADEFTKGELRPAGDCNYVNHTIRVREGKSLEGQVTTLIHELTHAIALGGNSFYCWPGERYYELAAESVTQFVTQVIGIDRTKKTAKRINRYGFGDYLDTPLTQTIAKIILNELSD